FNKFSENILLSDQKGSAAQMGPRELLRRQACEIQDRHRATCVKVAGRPEERAQAPTDTRRSLAAVHAPGEAAWKRMPISRARRTRQLRWRFASTGGKSRQREFSQSAAAIRPQAGNMRQSRLLLAQ